MSRKMAHDALALFIFVFSQFPERGHVGLAAPLPPLANVQVNEAHPGDNPAETTVAADPADPKHFVAAWIELTDPTLTRGVIGYASTKDGGSSWRSALLGVPEFPILFDPSIVSDSMGNFYLTCAAAVIDPQFVLLESHLLRFKSTDGGKTFFKILDMPALDFSDKPFLTVDPATDALYLVWGDSLPGSGFQFSIFFSKSLDRASRSRRPR